VRTIREEGCGDPFLPPAAPERDEAALRYQLKAFWDLKDTDGVSRGAGRIRDPRPLLSVLRPGRDAEDHGELTTETTRENAEALCVLCGKSPAA
jgi:hypothetical protein